MVEFLGRAEAEAPGRRFGIALEGLVDLVLDHRQVMAALQGDPGVAGSVRFDRQMQDRINRLTLLLSRPDPDVSTPVAVSMVGGGLRLVGADPQLARRLLRLPGSQRRR